MRSGGVTGRTPWPRLKICTAARQSGGKNLPGRRAAIASPPITRSDRDRDYPERPSSACNGLRCPSRRSHAAYPSSTAIDRASGDIPAARHAGTARESESRGTPKDGRSFGAPPRSARAGSMTPASRWPKSPAIGPPPSCRTAAAPLRPAADLRRRDDPDRRRFQRDGRSAPRNPQDRSNAHLPDACSQSRLEPFPSTI